MRMTVRVGRLAVVLLLTLGASMALAQSRGVRSRRALPSSPAAGASSSPLGRSAVRPQGRAELSEVSRGRFRTPSGLTIPQAALDQLMVATRPRAKELDSPTFRGGRAGAVDSVDRAYARIQRNEGIISDQTVSGQRTVVVRMERPVGFLAGRLWQARPALLYMQLTLRGTELVSAQPSTRPNQPVALGGRWSRPAASEDARQGRDARQYRSLLMRAGLSEREAATAMTHAELGLPTRARVGQASDHLQVNERGGFVSSYHNQTGVVSWVSYAVRNVDVTNSLRRSDNWRPDRSLPRDWRRFRADDFILNGYDIGHLVQSAARLSSRESNQQTFLLSTNVPQTPNNNRGPWRHLEEQIRAEARAGATVHVITGPAFTGPRRTVGEGGAAIPDALWKVAVIQPPGAPLDERARVIAIQIPNDDSRVSLSEGYGRFRVSVAEIESMTGFRFFTNLPAAVADRLRQRVDAQEVPSLGSLERSSQSARASGPRAAPDPDAAARTRDRALLSDGAAQFPPRLRELGYDPGQGRFRPDLAQTAGRLERRGMRLEVDAASHDARWIDRTSGQRIKAVGRDGPDGRIDVPRLRDSIVRNLERVDRVVIDLQNFRAENRAEVRQLAAGLPSADQARVLILE